ncbi:MAG: CoA pyrophosphatase [Planctomycetaceae bacterium]
MTPPLSKIRECLAGYHSEHQMDGAVRRAAVAMIVREPDGEPQILLIKRADKTGDPWSGQMAFPGGHLNAADFSARHAAERETLEEIGLDLAVNGRLIGTLEPQRPLIRITGIAMAVAPYVYELAPSHDRFELNSEVAELHWAPIGPMLRHENLTRIDSELGGERLSLPGFNVDGRIVWGMTFRMLNRLFSLIDPEFHPLD